VNDFQIVWSVVFQIDYGSHSFLNQIDFYFQQILNGCEIENQISYYLNQNDGNPVNEVSLNDFLIQNGFCYLFANLDFHFLIWVFDFLTDYQIGSMHGMNEIDFETVVEVNLTLNHDALKRILVLVLLNVD
jgi:hypothetical protein